MSDNTNSIADTIYPAATPGGAAGDSGQTSAPPVAPEVPATPSEGTAAPEPKAETLLAAAEAEPKAEPEVPPFNPEGITTPEGVTIDPEVFGKFSEIAKDSGMSHATAQSLMDLYHSVISSQETKNLDAWKTTR